MTTRPRLLALVALALFIALSFSRAAEPASLAGSWAFALDRTDLGLSQRWFTRPLTNTIQLPGSLPQQGFGDPVSLSTPWHAQIQDPNWHRKPPFAAFASSNNFHFPFWLQPTTYYAGAAWFQRRIEIPSSWAARRVVLTLERPHWETRVWIDDRFIGVNDSLSTAHEHDLGSLEPGAHTLTIRVDNRMIVDVGINSHSVSDHTQGNWNGIVGSIQLEATPLTWIDDLQIYPNLASKSVTVRGRLGNRTDQSGQGSVTLEAHLGSTPTPPAQRPPAVTKTIPVEWTRQGGVFAANLSLGAAAELWDEFHPAVYTLTATLEGLDPRSVSFGLREIRTAGTQFLINDQPVLFRGTLECAIFPATGHPPTDVESWKRIIRICQAHGLNHIRFHSWCPPEAAFIAADHLGFYYQVEVASWANQSTTLGDGKPVDDWIYRETERILRAYGNHPSFLLLPYGNEPGGPKHRAFLAKWINHCKNLDPRRLYSSGSGWPQIPENQFHVSPDPRIQAWGAGLKSRINAAPPETRTDYRDYIQARPVPVISHEIGQWCVYPNFDEMSQYTGYLKPRNFEIFQSTLRSQHLGDLARPFLIASGKLQTLCYKEEIEAILRTPGIGGFQLLDLHDFPGQGTALVGILDPFWNSKGYVTPEQFRRFCNSTVPLARLPKRVFTTDDALEAALEVAHFGRPLSDATLEWKILNSKNRVVQQGALPARALPVGNGIPFGQVKLPLRDLPAPAQYRLAAGLAGTEFENDWDFWVYPSDLPTGIPSSVLTVTHLNEAAIKALDEGRTVLWLVPPQSVKGDALGPVALGFSSIFWNTVWTQRQPPHTLGILCDPAHPLFQRFPTESHSNWQWWYLVHRAGAMILDSLPPELRPNVQVIDDWVTNRRLGLVFEAKVLRGKLIVCSIDLEHDLESDAVRRQFRYSLLRYLESESFQPSVSVTIDQLRTLVIDRTEK